ncbi:MAG: type II toxin-antitoxin system RelE/ParE family toxin [Terracidiphilus sp.]
MPAYQLSNLARLDLINIADYTVDAWGPEQAQRYLDSLETCFNRLAKAPQIGRPCNRIQPGYRRFEQMRHVILYRAGLDGIFIGRVLHQRMLPSIHLIDDA